MRVVVDANILASGVFWAGTPGRVLQLWVDGRIELIASAEIVREYEEVISEMAACRGRPDLAQRWARFLAEHLTLVDVEPRLTICRDPDDDRYLDCAVQGMAAVIVSGDKDLLSLGAVNGIPIRTARLFLSTLGQ